MCTCICLRSTTCIAVAGTTWLQEIVFLIHSDLDFEKSADQNLDQRFPFIELGVHVVTESASPRLIKSHLPYEFMPNDLKQGNGKVIYIVYTVYNSIHLLHTRMYNSSN